MTSFFMPSGNEINISFFNLPLLYKKMMKALVNPFDPSEAIAPTGLYSSWRTPTFLNAENY